MIPHKRTGDVSQLNETSGCNRGGELKCDRGNVSMFNDVSVCNTEDGLERNGEAINH